MSDQMTLWDTPNVTSSQVADSGALPCVKLDGPTTAPSGQALARAPASARQAKAKGLQTLVTSGLLGHDSSASVDLQQSLESKLVPRLDTAGSTLFRLIWKHKTTPLGRSYLERQALARHTSGNDFTSLGSWQTPEALNQDGYQVANGKQWPRLGAQARTAAWPTPQAADVSRVEMDRLKHDRQTRDPNMPGSYRYELPDVARMASWSTPKAEDSECAGAHRGTADTLHSQANLAGWPTPMTINTTSAKAQTQRPTAGPQRGGASYGLENIASLAAWATPAERDYRTANLKSFQERGGGKKGEQLQNQVKLLAAWPTPAVDSFRPRSGDRINEMGLDQMARTIPQCPAGPVRLTAGGQVLTGSDAGMESSGQLCPLHSLWLQGIPRVWALFVPLKTKRGRK